MTWHLKDRELEKKLIAIDPNFVKTLTDTVEEKLTNNWFNDDYGTDVELTYNGEYLGTVSFFTNRLDKVPEYNPHAWNEYPKVTPPYDVMMLIDLAKKTHGLKGFYRHSKEGDCWCFADGSTVPTCLSEKIIRFRPWED